MAVFFHTHVFQNATPVGLTPGWRAPDYLPAIPLRLTASWSADVDGRLVCHRRVIAAGSNL